MRIGAALHCEIRPSEFARKNYFYPDQAKDYQISQYDLPLNVDGWLELPDGFRVGVTRAHMEEDTGKLTHVGASGRINAAHHALVDYNRSGVPLVEIVSEPDIRTVGAGPGLRERAARHPHGHRRIRRPHGGGLHARRRQRFGPPAGHRRLRHPLRDQEPELPALAWGGPSSTRRRGRSPSSSPERPIVQETRHWDESAGTHGFHALEGRGQRLPVLPRARPGAAGARRGLAGAGAVRTRSRCRRTGAVPLAAALGGAPTDAEMDQIHAVVDLGLDGLVAAAADGGAPAALALARAANEVAAQSEAGQSLDPAAFAAVLAMESGGQLSATQSKAVLGALLERGGGDPAAVAKEMGFEALGSRHAGRGSRRGRRRQPRRVGVASSTVRTSWRGSSSERSWTPPQGRRTARRSRPSCGPRRGRLVCLSPVSR